MNNNVYTIIISLISVLLLPGCFQNSLFLPGPPSPIPSSTATPKPTSTATMIATPLPSDTPTTVPTETLTPTLSSTSIPNTSCANNKPYKAKWSSVQQGMHFEAFLCPDETFIAIMRDQNIPEYITVNLRGFSQMEYFWGVRIDIDSDENTGGQIQYHYIDSKGADCDISLAHWSNGRPDTKLFEDRNAFQVNVWNKGKLDSWAKMFVDRENKILILRGIVPGASDKSRILFVKFYRTPDNKNNYKTNWIDSESSQK